MDSIWSTFEQNSEKFFVQSTHKQLPDGTDEITCWLTDLKVLYSETLRGMVEVMERVKNENPFLLLSSDTEENVLKTILTLPSKSATAKADQITFSREKNRLQVKYCLSESAPLKFYWTLSKCNETVFFEMLTVPLLRQLVHAEENTRDLVNIVEKKDLEIEQYKLDGALPLTRKQFVTERFDATQMKSQVEPLFDCSMSDLLPADTTNAVDDVVTVHLVVSSNSRRSEMSNVDKADDMPAKTFVPKRLRPSKLKRNRAYDEEFNGPFKLQYADSDDQCDDDDGSNSNVKSDSSSSKSNSHSSTTNTTVDSNSYDDALSTKTPTKKIRTKFNF